MTASERIAQDIAATLAAIDDAGSVERDRLYERLKNLRSLDGSAAAEIKTAIETATNLDGLETLIGLANVSAITDPASTSKSILGLLAGLLTTQTRRYRVGSEVVTGTTPKTYGSGATANLISISISVQSGSVAITGGATITVSDPAVTFGNGSVSRLLDSATPITLTGGSATDRYLVIWETEV